MQFCLAVERNLETEKVLHYSTIRRKTWPFLISTLFVQSKILSLPVEQLTSFYQRALGAVLKRMKIEILDAVSPRTSVVLIKVSD